MERAESAVGDGHESDDGHRTGGARPPESLTGTLFSSNDGKYRSRRGKQPDHDCRVTRRRGLQCKRGEQ